MFKIKTSLQNVFKLYAVFFAKLHMNCYKHHTIQKNNYRFRMNYWQKLLNGFFDNFQGEKIFFQPLQNYWTDDWFLNLTFLANIKITSSLSVSAAHSGVGFFFPLKDFTLNIMTKKGFREKPTSRSLQAHAPTTCLPALWTQRKMLKSLYPEGK